MNNFELIIGNKIYSNWKEVYVHKSLSKLAGYFRVAAYEALLDYPPQWHLKNGQACEIRIGEDSILKGYIDEINISYDNEKHSIEISGRDSTADLVDCSFVNPDRKINEWIGQSMKQIVTALCAPFNIEVVVENEARDEPIKKAVNETVGSSYIVNDSETVADSIFRLSRVKALMAIAKGDGKLTLTRAGTSYASDSLVLGDNIKGGELLQSDRNRYSIYIVKGTGKTDSISLLPTGGGDEDLLNPLAEVEDEVVSKKIEGLSDRSTVVRRYRPLVILADINTIYALSGDIERKGIKDASITICRDRAEWEARHRAGKSRKIKYTVQDWLQRSVNKAWMINMLVRVKDTLLGLDGDFLITDIDYTFDENNGTNTILTLSFKEAFELRGANVKRIKTKQDDISTSLLPPGTVI